MKKRLKWEPAALMAIVLGLGMWIAFGPASRPRLDVRPGALTQDFRVGNTRGLIEATPAADGQYLFRILLPGQAPGSEMSQQQAAAVLGQSTVDETIATSHNWVFRRLNITSWVGVVWLSIGLLGQFAFSGRMILQWITSERKRQSIITESFWWFSLFGSLLLFSYFVWRQDPVAMLGQASGIVVYARNLRLIHKHRRRARRVGEHAVVTHSAHAATAASSSPAPAEVVTSRRERETVDV